MDVDSLPPPPPIQYWIAWLHLTVADRGICDRVKMLTDTFMEAAARIFRKQFACQGLQTTLLVKSPNGFKHVDGKRIVQFHHNGHLHWQSSTNIFDESVVLFDSMRPNEPNDVTLMQLSQIYHEHDSNGVLVVKLPDVQMQSGGIVCGDFAMHFLYEALAGTPLEQIQRMQVDQPKMREHTKACLEAGVFSRYPMVHVQPSERARRSKDSVPRVRTALLCTHDLDLEFV
jgi:hypothetical protein